MHWYTAQSTGVESDAKKHVISCLSNAHCHTSSQHALQPIHMHKGLTVLLPLYMGLGLQGLRGAARAGLPGWCLPSSALAACPLAFCPSQVMGKPVSTALLFMLSVSRYIIMCSVKQQHKLGTTSKTGWYENQDCA